MNDLLNFVSALDFSNLYRHACADPFMLAAYVSCPRL